MTRQRGERRSAKEGFFGSRERAPHASRSSRGPAASLIACAAVLLSLSADDRGQPVPACQHWSGSRASRRRAGWIHIQGCGTSTFNAFFIASVGSVVVVRALREVLRTSYLRLKDELSETPPPCRRPAWDAEWDFAREDRYGRPPSGPPPPPPPSKRDWSDEKDYQRYSDKPSMRNDLANRRRYAGHVFWAPLELSDAPLSLTGTIGASRSRLLLPTTAAPCYPTPCRPLLDPPSTRNRSLPTCLPAGAAAVATSAAAAAITAALRPPAAPAVLIVGRRQAICRAALEGLALTAGRTTGRRPRRRFCRPVGIPRLRHESEASAGEALFICGI